MEMVVLAYFSALSAALVGATFWVGYLAGRADTLYQTARKHHGE